MGLTYAQAKALGLAHLYPTESKALPEAPRPASKHVDDGMNKLERAFWLRLQEVSRSGLFLEVYREPITLRLAGRTRYTPDFLARTPDGAMRFYETKGFMRDDAAVKLKVAASLYPFFNFYLVVRERRVWLCREVTARGISHDVWTPDWLR